MIGRSTSSGRAMIEAIALGAATGVMYLLVGGLRRWPWRYAGISALGWGVVFSALRLSAPDVDAGSLVLIGAIGGSLTSLGWERGERERIRRSASILGARPSSLP